MNMRDSWPSSTINVAFYLSDDQYLDAGDTRLNTVGLTNVQAGAIYGYYLNAYIYPQTQLPIGQYRCILVVSDPDDDHNEYRENDNATDTKICFVRY